MSASLRQQPCDLDLARARRFLSADRKDEAYAAYIELLNYDPKNPSALHELGCLASADGFNIPARRIFQQLVDYWPQDLIGRLNLGNLLYEEGDLSAARSHFEFVLKADADSSHANRGLGRVLYDGGDIDAADRHWRRSFSGQAVTTEPYLGQGKGIPLLVLGSARRGNIPTRRIIDHRVFAVTVLYAEYYRPELPLPPHALVFNSIGDADLCPAALVAADAIIARTNAPVINAPCRVSLTGRASNAARLAAWPGVRTPKISVLPRNDLYKVDELIFPMLLRAAGFHNGEHFVRVESREDLAIAVAQMPEADLLAIEYLDARGSDGMARKYRVMCIDGVLYPLHLAISANWKVHYLTADMATDPAYRAEEARFLENMPAVLGETAMKALTAMGEELALDYVGFDFALDRNGSVLLFEANPVMAINPPFRDQIWDYRRAPIDGALNAAKKLLTAKAGLLEFCDSPLAI